MGPVNTADDDAADDDDADDADEADERPEAGPVQDAS